MTVAHDFLTKLTAQREENRQEHGNDNRTMREWAMISVEHMGHLLREINHKNYENIEKELFHVAAPLLEIYHQLHTLKESQ